MTDPTLIEKYSLYIGQQIHKINPHEAKTTNYALYELGILRAVLARCILNDNKNEAILRSTIDAILHKNDQEV